MDETDKPSMKQLPLVIGSSTKKCSSACTKEINAALSDFIVLDLRTIAVVNGTGIN